MKYKQKYWLLVILVIASFLRLWKLSDVPVSMFGDELDVGYHAYSILKTGKDYSGNLMPINFQSLAEWRTPLYLYASVPTVALWGITPLGVRIPAALFGIISIWGMYALTKELLYRTKVSEAKGEKIATITAAVLALSPWHIQYSRAGFEVTMLLMFYLFGLYYFFKSIRTKSIGTSIHENNKSLETKNEEGYGGRYLWIGVIHLVLTPLIYNTAKFFTPILLIVLFCIWWKELLSLSKRYLLWAVVAGIIVGIPTTYATLGTGGVDRFGYLSIFSNPERESVIGMKREASALFNSDLNPSYSEVVDKIFYNKFTYWGEIITNNFSESISSEFLFLKGDPNLRHSVDGIGQMYVTEFIALMLGLGLFFSEKIDRKIKWFLGLWVILGILPSAITRDGGMHATRLFLILPPLAILVSYGISSLSDFKGRLSFIFTTVYLFLIAVSFISYQRNYWTINRFSSERWWHSGYGEAISYVKENQSKYDAVLISDKNEPPWIFFGAHMNYDPTRWQEVKPDANWVDTQKYGRVTMIDKYIFTSPNGQLYEWKLDSNTLFMASEKEVGINLLLEPDRTPSGLTLLETITYPSGAPAFYFFTGN